MTRKKTEGVDSKGRPILRDLARVNMYEYYSNKGYYFSKEILTRYFLSLKTKPFVILTGISGTGKTKIAQIFADYMCQDEEPEEREKRIAFIPVRPDWMDNKGLLGFYNILDEKYYATRLLNLLLEAKENPDKPYFVILDEMNLAKVEQYFSDFLSIMESRTADRIEGEKVTLHSVEKADTPDNKTVPREINIPSNVFFTGTVNVDETTYMFSPKVLDRANVIEFNEVDLEGYIESITAKEDSFCLSNPDVRKDLISKEEEIDPFCSRKDYKKFKDIIGDEDNPIQELLDRLKKYNLHFGYRVVNEISRFVWLSEKALGDQFNLEDTIDIQILQKVLPKFHGTQGKLEGPMTDLLAFCNDEEGDVSNETLEKAIEYDEGVRFPRSAQKIARMIKNLKSQGYASFIE